MASVTMPLITQIVFMTEVGTIFKPLIRFLLLKIFFCQFHLGDCCLPEVDTSMCFYCKCQEDYEPTTTTLASEANLCNNALTHFVGDGSCDDENNYASCNYDEGDCCLPVVDTTYCTKCICKNGPVTTSEPQTTMDSTMGTTTIEMEQTTKTSVNTGQNGCKYPEHVGDGFCNDATNKEICDYDGGDCCTIFINVEYCRTCICHEDGKRHLEIGMNITELGPCPIQHYKDDGFCDDETNISDCDWDGGDCCREVPFNDFCTECMCKDPEGQE